MKVNIGRASLLITFELDGEIDKSTLSQSLWGICFSCARDKKEEGKVEEEVKGQRNGLAYFYLPVLLLPIQILLLTNFNVTRVMFAIIFCITGSIK